MNGKTPGKRSLRPSLPTLRLTALVVLYVAALSGLIYSVYGRQRPETLTVGEPSRQLYKSPVDIEVVDQLATERERQLARAQVSPFYSSDPQLQRLVLDAVTTAGLPTNVRDFIVSAYEQPRGVSEQEMPGLIEQASLLAEPERRNEVRATLERRLIATSRLNNQLTEAAREAAANAVPPVMVKLQAGQTIVREGELLTADHLRVLEAVGLYAPEAKAVTRQASVILSCIFLALLLSLPLPYVQHHLKQQLSNEQIIFLASLALLAVALQRLAFLADEGFLFASFVPLLAAVLVSELVAVIIGVWLSVVVALMAPAATLSVLLTMLVGAVVASLQARLFKTRTTLLLAGSVGGFASGVTFLVYHLLVGNVGTLTLLTSLLWLLGGGVLAGILALGLLPIAESNVGFLTEFRLLELSSPSSPLLQKLLLEAPGSYQHSLIISNLVEQAVAHIGGNALLARVGALYHDVGKLKRPQFFVENQFSGENPHDQLSPHLSYLIITSHVRDGVELLREHKLPKALTPFVLEHHGTTMLTYFYKRALEDNANIDELNFRYPGPRPRSKESAVLMLADAVESASRTLSEPSQKNIRAMIDRLIEQRLQDGQLAASPLNLHDLEVIASTFERMLTAILHRRIRYPSAEEIQGLKRGRDTRRNPALPLS